MHRAGWDCERIGNCRGDRNAILLNEFRPDGKPHLRGRRLASRVTRAGDRLFVQLPTTTVDVHVVPRFSVAGGHGETHGGLVAPMPGVVHAVHCAVGDRVVARQPLVVLEAMKMEHQVTAPTAGTVTEVRVSAGEHVTTGTVLAVIEGT